jgi:urea carboxylase
LHVRAERGCSDAIAAIIQERSGQPKVVYRLSGGAYLLVEYGEMTLDLDLRFRVHSLEQSIKSIPVEGVLETVPGVRSLLVKYNGLQLPLSRLLETLKSIEKASPQFRKSKFPRESSTYQLPFMTDGHWRP